MRQINAGLRKVVSRLVRPGRAGAVLVVAVECRVFRAAVDRAAAVADVREVVEVVEVAEVVEAAVVEAAVVEVAEAEVVVAAAAEEEAAAVVEVVGRTR
jgi:hypothetical protein